MAAQMFESEYMPRAILRDAGRNNRAFWTTVRLTALALAACLLVAVGIAILSPGSGRQLADARFYDQAKAQLEHGQFDQAHETLTAPPKKMACNRTGCSA